MFASDKSNGAIVQLIGKLRRYGELKLESLQIDIITRLTQVFTMLIMGVVLWGILLVVLFFVSFAIFFLLSPNLGYVGSAFMVAGGNLLLALLLYVFRQGLIMEPIAHLLAGILLPETAAEKEVDEADDTFIQSERS